MMRSFVFCWTLFVLSVGHRSAIAAPPAIPVGIQSALQDRRYDDALKAIDVALKDPKAKLPDYLLYLRARTLHFQKKYAAAVKQFDDLAKLHPNSKWSRQARLAKGVSLAKAGKFKEAAVAYQREAKFLVSAARRQTIAGIYLELADAHFAPKRVGVKPNFTIARQFYLKAIEIGPQLEKMRDVRMRIAQCSQKLGQFAAAAQQYEGFLKKFPRDELTVEARFQLGDSYASAGTNEAARRAWEDLLRLHPNSKSPRIAAGAFRIGLTYGLPNPNSQLELARGVASLRQFLKRFAKHKLASRAYLSIAESYQNSGRFSEAATVLQEYLKNKAYAADPEYPEARLLLGFAYGRQEKFQLAIDVWKQFLTNHPTHKLWQSAQTEIINAKYLRADLLSRQKKYQQAKKLWDLFLTEYPIDTRNQAIMYRFGDMEYEQKKYKKAITLWQMLVAKYPSSDEADRAQFMIAQTLESQLGRPAEAIEILRKTKGKMRSAAQALLDQITSRQLIIATERAFRTDEIPTVKVNARNIEQLHISVYRLDVESYFRKMRQIGGIGSLDIDLIDPDYSFDFKVPNYKRYQAAEHRVPVLPTKGKKPNRKPMAMVVTVSSKTLKATTLVLRSDLEIVVRSSRHDTLVFAQNMRSGRPWPKARVLLSDGKRIFTETVTGKDGVVHKRFSSPMANLRILAVANGHVAATHGDMAGPKMAKTIRNAGYAYTDRPIYQPGEMVHLKGIVGRSIGSKDKLRIRVFDPENKEIVNQQKQVSAFGTVAARIQLPDAAKQGIYRLLVTKDGDVRTTFTRQFTVKKYKLNQVRLEVLLDSPVVFRGEKITGIIRATHYHGTPLANTPIQYQLIGAAQKTKLTDKRGELRFEFSSPESRASILIESIRAYLPSRNIQRLVKVVIAEREFDLQVSTIRRVFLANEPFEVSIATQGVAGRQIKPSQPIQISVFAMTEVQGKVGSRLLRTIRIPVKDLAVHRTTIKLAKGGRYVLQASTADRRGTRVVGETVIGISDESDQKRLRILANRKRWALGDEAKTTIVWREKPALALVTLQADQLIQYQLVQLQRGRNAHKIPIYQALSPNFQMSVSVINDRRHRARVGKVDTLPQEHWISQSTTEFTVEKGLDIRLRTARRGRPGGPLTVTLETRDRRKRPVAAEVSLAVIDKSLLDSYGIKGDIVSAFAWPRRAMSVRSTSSIRFGYSPTTSLINPRLLAESERKKLTALELKKRSS